MQNGEWRDTKIGELAASNHANNAVGEMIDLQNAFVELKKKYPDFEMKAWNELEVYMPKTIEEWKSCNNEFELQK